MTFTLGTNSRAELRGVDPRLVACVERAIAISPVDFSVHDGIRTEAEQRRYVASGVSKTMKSKHLHGDAVDLVPWIAGKLRWEWPPIYQIAAAMLVAARESGVTLRWGGVWDRSLNDLGVGIDDIETLPRALELAVAAYCDRHPGPDFIDGPHFEVVR